MEGIPEKIDSKFRFVLLAAERAEQMMKGSPPKLEDGETKVTSRAIREIRQDVVEWDYGPAEVEEEEILGEETLELAEASEAE